jgi:hypothetical protein
VKTVFNGAKRERNAATKSKPDVPLSGSSLVERKAIAILGRFRVYRFVANKNCFASYRRPLPNLSQISPVTQSRLSSTKELLTSMMSNISTQLFFLGSVAMFFIICEDDKICKIRNTLTIMFYTVLFILFLAYLHI